MAGHAASYRFAAPPPSPIVPAGLFYCLAAPAHANSAAASEHKSKESPMEISRERDGEVVVVRLTGRLDSSAASAAEEGLLVALGGVPPRLAVDMTGLSYISSAGLRVLLVVAKKVQQQHGKLALFGLSPNVREVFSVSGFDTIFSIAGDSAAALAAVR
jgi:anti-anti-sigma factor